MEITIICIGLLYFFSHYLTVLYQKTRIPDVLILIIVGILIGPVFKLASIDSLGMLGQVLTSVALIIILFEGGLNMELSNIWGSMRTAAKLTVSFFFITAMIVGLLLHYMLHYSWLLSFITGFILGGTSSAVVLPMVSLLRMSDKPRTILVLESALTDVLCIVFAISFLSSYSTGIVEIGKIAGSLISSLVLASALGVGAGYIWLRLMTWIKTFPNTQFTTFAFMFIVYGLAEYFGFSGAISALAFGIVLGNYSKIPMPQKIKDQLPDGIITELERRLYSEIVFLLKIYFFVYLGMAIPFESSYFFIIAAALVGAIYLARLFSTRFLVRDTDIKWEDKSVMSAMVPKGLAAAVLAGLPLQYGIPEGSEIQIIVYNVVFVSILVTSILIPLIRTRFISRFYRVFFRPIPKLEKLAVSGRGSGSKEPDTNVVENKEDNL
ncbi:MAG: cation:proton antiporter [Salinivirgaceae bacterium]|nr:cation:proton antiporter [Salinivirgaceae bacterium]